jgi:prepilin signal peptidase PulO-like enzyme (type II secretory pathway)
MEIFLGVTFFAFGTIVGSFLNVVVLRYNTGVSVRGRSMCVACRHTLHWYELFPIASFLIQQGRCRVCKSRISIQYPLIEFVTGIIFLATFFTLFSGQFTINFLFSIFYSLLVLSLLISISVYDIHHKIIPDGLVYAFITLSLVTLFLDFKTPYFRIPTSSEFLAGPILMLPFFLLWFLSRGKWMGLGDAKLALGIGWFLGMFNGISAIMWGFWLGALYSLGILALKALLRGSRSTRLSLQLRRFTIKSEVPFAPFLILGFFLWH